MEEKKRKLGSVSVFAAAFLWGFVGVFVRKMTAYGFSAIQMTAVRSFITWLILFFYLFFTDRQKLKIRFKDIWLFALMGIVSILSFNVLYFYTIQIADVSIAAVLLYVWPVLVMLSSIIIFGETFTIRKFFSAVISFLGCFIVMGMWKKGGLHAVVFLTGIGSALTYATYSIFGVFALRKYHSLTILLYAFAFATIGCLPFISLSGTFQLFFVNPMVLGVAVAQGILTSALPYIFFNQGLKNLEAGIAAILTSSVPMISTIVNAIIYKEALQPTQLMGSFLIIVSIVLIQLPRKKKENN